jgi:hypothetical protein
VGTILVASKYGFAMEELAEFKVLSLKPRGNRVKQSLAGLGQTWGGMATALQPREEEEGEAGE